MANVNASKFMGASFAAGNKLEKRVGNNERKITLLKNIVGARKDGPSIGEKIKGGSSLDQSIQNITNTVTNISETLKARHEWEKEQAAKEGIELEQAQRDKAEKGSEAKAFTALKETSEKVLAPVKSIFDRILDVIKKLILGKIAMNIFDWFTNPENQSKVQSIIKFFKDWWPTLLAGYLLFGNAFGRFVVKIIAQVGIWIAKSIPMMIKALAAALTKLKAMKWLKLLGGGRGLKALKISSVIGGGVVLTDRILNPEEVVGDNQGDQGGGDNQGDQGGEQQFTTGGFVSGPAGVDRVPAKLTAGEFVMSKGAVQKYGADTLEGMNAAAGGTNRPTAGGGYQGGGLVEKFKLEYPNLSTDQIQAVIDQEKNNMSLRGNTSTPHPLISAPKVTPRSLEERVADTLHVDYAPSSGGVAIDFSGLQGPQGSQGPQGVQGSSLQGPQGVAGTEVHAKAWWDPLGVFTGKKKTSAQLSPTGVKNEVGQSVKKSKTTAALTALKADASKVGGTSGGGGGDKIPNFNPAEKISENKIRTLGISV